MTAAPSRKFPQPLRGALFDLDGTLVDTEGMHLESINRLLGGDGQRLSMSELQPYIGWAEIPFWEALRERFGLRLEARELTTLREEHVLELLHGTRIEPLPGVRALLEALGSAGVPCAVASSSTRLVIAAILASAGLEEWIGAYRSGHDDVDHGKPAPDVYRAAAEAIGVNPADCLAIEDSATGVASAMAAGAFVIAVPCASHPDRDLTAADLRLERVDELLPRLLAG